MSFPVKENHSLQCICQPVGRAFLLLEKVCFFFEVLYIIETNSLPVGFHIFLLNLCYYVMKNFILNGYLGTSLGSYVAIEQDVFYIF